MENERKEMVERFMKHGIDISPYRFQDYEDKYQFFTMYINYLDSMDNGVEGYICDFDEEINLEVYDKSHAMLGIFRISEDYQTLKFIMASSEEITDEYARHINFLVTVFFLVLKEFNASIKTLQSVLGTSGERAKKKYKDVSEFDKKVNKIMEIQKMIRSENRKYEVFSKKKGDNDEEH